MASQCLQAYPVPEPPEAIRSKWPGTYSRFRHAMTAGKVNRGMDSNATRWKIASTGRGLLLLLALGLPLGFCESAAANDQIQLTGKAWQISIDPATLEATGSPRGMPQLLISAAQKLGGGATEIHTDQRSAKWQLDAAKLHVEMQLDEKDALNVKFVSTSVGSFTWPILGAHPACRAFIVPLFEGLYVPTDDRPWSDFLTK